MKQLKMSIIDVKKYGGRQVALVRGKVIASGTSTKAVLESARRRIPKKQHSQIWLFTVPKGLTFVYCL